jgi:four helix bundle protein
MEETMDGRMEGWMSPRRNINRGYRQLVVWQDAIEYYVLTCDIFRSFPYELRRIAANQMAAADSIHRNIAEGYCRRTLKEYLQHLNIALGSAGETVSGLHAYRRSNQITPDQFEKCDAIAYTMENGLKRLIESLQHKLEEGDWNESFIVRESNAAYEIPQSSTLSPIHPSTHPTIHSSAAYANP